MLVYRATSPSLTCGGSHARHGATHGTWCRSSESGHRTFANNLVTEHDLFGPDPAQEDGFQARIHIDPCLLCTKQTILAHWFDPCSPSTVLQLVSQPHAMRSSVEAFWYIPWETHPWFAARNPPSLSILAEHFAAYPPKSLDFT